MVYKLKTLCRRAKVFNWNEEIGCMSSRIPPVYPRQLNNKLNFGENKSECNPPVTKRGIKRKKPG